MMVVMTIMKQNEAKPKMPKQNEDPGLTTCIVDSRYLDLAYLE